MVSGFSEALPVFSDDYALTIIDDESDPDEQRFITLGLAAKVVCLLSSTHIGATIFG
jgi:hypothetical protein